MLLSSRAAGGGGGGLSSSSTPASPARAAPSARPVNVSALIAQVRAALAAGAASFPVLPPPPSSAATPTGGGGGGGASSPSSAPKRPPLPFPHAAWLARACKLTEMDVRSPGFAVKLALFVPLLRLAATRQQSPAETARVSTAVDALEQCVLQREGERKVGASPSKSRQERRLEEESHRKIVARLVARAMSTLTTTAPAAAKLVLDKTPPPPVKPLALFPASGSRTMKSSRACHAAWDFLLMVSGRPSSRGIASSSSSSSSSSSKSGLGNKKNNSSRKKGVSAAPLAPSSPRTARSPLAAPPVPGPSEFDYFGGASISSARSPLHPDLNARVRGQRRRRRGAGDDGDKAAEQALEQATARVNELERKLAEAEALNTRLVNQSHLVEDSPESCALALDARRLMVAEARGFQLEGQVEALLSALEGQQQVVDHAERILLELADMGAKRLLSNAKVGRNETVTQRVVNLLSRLRASARAAASARADAAGRSRS